MIEVCDSLESEPREFNGQDDHVHLLVVHPPKVAISKLVNSLTGVCSRYPRKEFTAGARPDPHAGRFRSPSYFAASRGGAPISIIRQYIEQQRRSS